MPVSQDPAPHRGADAGVRVVVKIISEMEGFKGQSSWPSHPHGCGRTQSTTPLLGPSAWLVVGAVLAAGNQ